MVVLADARRAGRVSTPALAGPAVHELAVRCGDQPAAGAALAGHARPPLLRAGGQRQQAQPDTEARLTERCASSRHARSPWLG